MKRFLSLVIVLFSTSILAQENDEKKLRFNARLALGFQTFTFIGENYLSKGHSKPAIGGEIDLNLIKYSKLNLGVGIKKTFLKVEETSIGGNVDKSNLNHYLVFISYDIFKKNKLSVLPILNYGEIEIRQYKNSIFFGTQRGNFTSLEIKSIYNLNSTFDIYAKFGFSKYFLNARTTNEFQNYFDQSNSLNFSLGFQF